MSNNEALITIETSDLIHINGGGGGRVEVEAHGPAGTGGTLRVEANQSNYELCVAHARQTAVEEFPDRRNPWEQFTNVVDPNAPRRARATREAIRACGPPPAGS